MVNLIQPTEVITPVIADLQGFLLRDSPIHQRIALAFDALRLICGDTHITHGPVLSFQPVDFLMDEMRFQLPRTPAHTGTGPAVSV